MINKFVLRLFLGSLVLFLSAPLVVVAGV
ncbi:MAG TPA: spermidine/putrescine ABC transporter permease, partial [Thalassospira sp.]|nr:spermidine/putrescine ABC transporter permease [Thalassospira sp.]